MALVRPLEKTFAEQVAEPDIVKLFSTHLWVGLRGKWDSEKLSNILQESFYQYVNIPIGLAAWRHIATSIVRRKLTGQLGLQAEIKDWLVEMMANEQAGHSHELANQIYGGEVQGLGGAMHERELKRYLLVSTPALNSILWALTVYRSVTSGMLLWASNLVVLFHCLMCSEMPSLQAKKSLPLRQLKMQS
jgi:hypothetical protein